MIQYFGKHNYVRLAGDGYIPDRTGEHVLWAWSGDGTISLRFGRKSVTGPENPRRGFHWTRLGSARLKRGVSCRIRSIDGEASTPPLIAITTSAADTPAKHYPRTHVHHSSPDPLPDARAALVAGVHTPRTLASYDSLQAWQVRSADIREHILATFGLSGGFPDNPLKPRIFGRIEREGYSIEKVEFQSLQGFYCHGNLYRPTSKGPHPGVLCPHGHCRNGRLEDSDEFFGSIPGRCINLARQGHVTFTYDMVGYNDSWQIPHRAFGGRLEDLWGIGIMGLQLINSSRALDFLQTLPDVDGDRIGCTGASGGGTQTFMLTAVDDRVKVAAPVNMISAHMQGGCNCENQAGLRVEVDNIDIARMMAPRPMIMVSATGDWTVNTPELEYPAVREVYRLFDAEDRIAGAQVDAGHNYNRQSREHVYAWFGKWLLGIDDPSRFREQPFQAETRPRLLVTHKRPRPRNAHTPDTISARLRSAAQTESADLRNSPKKAIAAYARVFGVETQPRVSARHLGQERTTECVITHLLLSREGSGDRIPVIRYRPRRRPRATLVLCCGDGKADLIAGNGRAGTLLKTLLGEGIQILAPDLFLTGESALNNGSDREAERHAATYNITNAQCRVQDIVTAVTFVSAAGGRVHLAGLKGCGIETLLACPFLRRIGSTLIDVAGTRVDDDTWWRDRCYIPGIRRVGDIVTAASLTAPGKLTVFGAGRGFPTSQIRAQYRRRATPGNLAIHSARPSVSQVVACLGK